MRSPDTPPSTERLSDARHRAVGGRVLDFADVPRLTDTKERTTALQRLQNHLIDISADPSGSDPRHYLSPNSLDTIAKLERKPEEERWRDATPLTHDDLTFHWLRRRRLNTPILDESGEQILGRRVGYFSVGAFEAPVLYCSDKKLRMLIKTTGHGRGEDTYSGYCRMPDPELALPVRDRGTMYLVEYRHQQSMTLEGELGLK